MNVECLMGHFKISMTPMYGLLRTHPLQTGLLGWNQGNNGNPSSFYSKTVSQYDLFLLSLWHLLDKYLVDGSIIVACHDRLVLDHLCSCKPIDSFVAHADCGWASQNIITSLSCKSNSPMSRVIKLDIIKPFYHVSMAVYEGRPVSQKSNQSHPMQTGGI